MALLIEISRTSLSLSALTITGSRATADDFWIPAGGYVRPQFQQRQTYAPDSAYIPGRQPLAVVLNDGNLPLTIGVKAANAATLAALRAVLSAAVAQWSYTVTVTLDGVAETWTCRAAWPTWPESAYWQRIGHEDRAVVTLPVEVP